MFAICRTQKLKTYGNAGGLNKHLTRTMEVPNADKDLQKYNQLLVGTEDLVSDIQKRITSAGIEPRKNAVLAVEHLLTASPEFFNCEKKVNEKGEVSLWCNQVNYKSFKDRSKEWLEERYGKDNVVNVTVHMDEKTPHLHAVVVPIDAKGKLNAREFLGGREKMREMQNSFAEKMKPIGLSRGIEGSKAKHTAIKDYYAVLKEAPEKLEAVNEMLYNRKLEELVTESRAFREEEAKRMKSLNSKVTDLQAQLHRETEERKQATDELKKVADELKESKKQLEKKEIHISVLDKKMTIEQALVEFEKIEEKYNPTQENNKSIVIRHSM